MKRLEFKRPLFSIRKSDANKWGGTLLQTRRSGFSGTAANRYLTKTNNWRTSYGRTGNVYSGADRRLSYRGVLSVSANGLSIEAAASVTARDMIKQHLVAFGFAIRTDRVASQATVAAYIDGLAAVVALTVAGRHSSREDVLNATVAKLREAMDRDLKHLKVQ